MIRDLLKQGFILKERGYYKYAIESFYKALELDNTSVELMLEIAECYYLMGNEEHSLNYIEQVLGDFPTHVGALKLLKSIFVSKKAWDKAEQTAKNIYFISKDLDDLADVFEMLNKQKRYEEVSLYVLEEKSSNLLYEKAYAKLFLNELDDAENIINRIIEENPNSKNYLLKCKILYKMNKKEECVEFFNKINLDETNPDALNFAGLIKQYECDFKKALEYFLQAVKLAPQNDEYYYNCASTYFKLGEIQQAKKYYNLAISLNPENPNYHFALANLYYSEKQYKRAIEELDCDLFEAKLLKSIILYDSGYLAIAKKELENLAQEEPCNELILEYRNKIEEELKI